MSELIVKDKPNPLKPNEVSWDERMRMIEEAEKKAMREKKNSPFKNFAQFNNSDEVINCCYAIADNKVAMKIFFFLMQKMDNYNAVMVSHQVLQELLGVSKPTITRAIKYLKDSGVIAVHKSGTSNVYTFNKKIAWKSWGENYQYCEFPANIILSKSEQVDSSTVKTKKVKQAVGKDKGGK